MVVPQPKVGEKDGEKAALAGKGKKGEEKEERNRLDGVHPVRHRHPGAALRVPRCTLGLAGGLAAGKNQTHTQENGQALLPGLDLSACPGGAGDPDGSGTHSVVECQISPPASARCGSARTGASTTGSPDGECLALLEITRAGRREYMPVWSRAIKCSGRSRSSSCYEQKELSSANVP